MSDTPSNPPRPRFTARTFPCRLIVCCLLTGWLSLTAAAADIPLLFPNRTCEITTVSGDAYWLNSLEFTTPRNPDKATPDQPAYAFHSAPTLIPFADIQKINLNPLTRHWLGSQPEEMEYYPLGSVRAEIPPPPNWHHTIDQIPPWHRAVAVRSVDRLPYLNHAVFCWAGESADTGETAGTRAAGVYLFRQGFTIDQPNQLAKATLNLATNADLLEVSLNENALSLPPGGDSLLTSFEALPLLRPGINILAIRVRERPGQLQSGSALGFNLELLDPAPGSAHPPQSEPGQALIVQPNGDRFWGWLSELREGRVRFETPYGDWIGPLTGMQEILFPSGWHERPPQPGLLDRLTGATAPQDNISSVRWGLPLDSQPQSMQDRLLLTENRVTTAHPTDLNGDNVTCESADGKRYSVTRDQVLGIYPPRPINWTFKRPKHEDDVLYCRVSTTAGDRISGFLRAMNGRRILLEIEGGSFLEFKSSHLSSLVFPYHAPSVNGNQGPLGLIGQIDDESADRNTYLSDAHAVEGAGFSIDVPVQNLELITLADTQRLVPQRCPVLINVDPAGGYLHTLKQDGDGRAALLNYVEKGGVLVAISRGGAFRQAVFSAKDGFRRAADELQAKPLLQDLGLINVRPGGKTAQQAGARSFVHPPNEKRELAFERKTEVPRDLRGLPQHIPLDPMMKSGFYPLVTAGGDAGTVIYQLTDENGESYGPGLALFPKGRGAVIIIDSLLWDSRPDGQPFGDRVLPLVLRWALNTAQAD